MIDAGQIGPADMVRIPAAYFVHAPLDEISWLRDSHAIPGFEVNVSEDLRTLDTIVRRRPLTPCITRLPAKGTHQ